MTAILYIVIAVIVFGVLIFLHEFGHFFTAKLCGIKVNEFAVGMGPALFKFQKGETRYSLRALPIGGFTAMEGEDGENNDPRAFVNRPVWQRIIVLVAGAFMNILTGFVIILIIIMLTNPIPSTTVAQFADGATSSQTGLRAGDRILSIDGAAVHINMDITLGLITSNKGKVNMQVLRGGKVVDLPAVQFPMTDDGNGGKVMARDFVVYAQQKTPGRVISYAFYWTIAMVKLVWVTILQMFTGRYSVKDLSGPVGVTAAMGQAASQSPSMLFNVVAMIAVNLGVVNLFPLPALDGGRLLFVIIEGIRRKPISRKYEGYVHLIGFALLMTLMLFVTFNDIVRLIKR
ncbi:RIP metalloprotease RseP [Ethanoligenens harbinense]|uniref:Zinc metalloprotease n=1 Tax=Ethanoligenens harbinense (strain DSM 18485 / JCM 12961 / CGMCC 1.5033 / YUAN-3) TaxID=663278 RepID=E6U8R8_ETHHY|nr:RIP metalloprotease RseP [Ethanoligenens harbinense]ADU27153.1 membrane-associated zinc metalloprotease [Ethanoligenens harbinense YUAN-3]AVQ96224.1 RIP metalloprotease RseP [Ethanoligenens harbinense YUAN-3]AYF38884.1 RIP metalloprotease RseP [Ethanoligenens harbinense]AYF41634.1 RIP metalloprotease RseP [Ethanoligenens harbinense]QCN92465.1 RIP metalloprotease RseP [Ethanoligenens harbinense]